jgi:hypothetical protein
MSSMNDVDVGLGCLCHPQAGQLPPTNDDGDVSFTEVITAESAAKERALKRISNANRERSASNITQLSQHDSDSEADFPLSSENPSQKRNNSFNDDDSDKKPFIHSPDVRKELFEAIPEPYYESAEFRRVMISTIKEDIIDIDTREACKSLDKCMKIREKWMSIHPFPPQDIPSSFADEDMIHRGGFDPVSPKARGYSMSTVPQTPVNPAADGGNGNGNGNGNGKSTKGIAFPPSPGDMPLAPNSSSSHLSMTSPGPVSSSHIGWGALASVVKATHEFRRRAGPPYEIFSKPLPEGTTAYDYKMINGVVVVIQVQRDNDKEEEEAAKALADRKETADYFAGSLDSDDNDLTLSSSRSPVSSPHRQIKKTIESKEKEQDWSKSLFPVPTFAEYYQDYVTVSLRSHCFPSLLLFSCLFFVLSIFSLFRTFLSSFSLFLLSSFSSFSSCLHTF